MLRDLGEVPPAALKCIPADFTGSELEHWSTVSDMRPHPAGSANGIDVRLSLWVFADGILE
jgi:hypothetical protein